MIELTLKTKEELIELQRRIALQLKILEEEELPVCQHCGSELAHPCDCQLYKEEEE